MEERSIDGDKMEEIMLPGFRFHPTDEELVGFYLRRKIELRPLPIELIKQLDIYKYDPWDLPKMATTGEKEWYFYCPRDRKYRNSARPNRVTGAGFWKATGTDRPIYSSESSKCIGLKKSLVFYKGRAAKGIKTDWMMHEFRLPSSTNDSPASRRFITKDIPANDAWAICRIFKKVNSTAQRATCHSWVSPVQHQTTPPGIPTHPLDTTTTIFTSDNTSSFTSKTSSLIQFGDTNEVLQSSKSSNFSPLQLLSYNSTNQITSQPSQLSISKSHQDLSTISNFLPNIQTLEPSKCCIEASTLLSNMPSSMFGDFGGIPQQQISDYSCPLPQDLRRSFLSHQEQMALESEWSASNEQFGIIPSVGSFPFNFPLNFVWDSMPCPSDISSTFSTNKCYT